MDFFNSLSQIAKNKNNFNKWEENQKQEQAKREALYQKRQYSDEELAKAKALGKNIIDVVDIMDNHSESVAENVETAVQPIVAGIPIITALGSTIAYAKYIVNPFYKKKWELQNNLSNNEDAIKLSQKITEFNTSNGTKNPKFRPWELTNENNIKRIKDPTLKDEAMKFYKQYKKDIAPLRHKVKIGKYGAIAAFLFSFVASNIYAAKLQVDSSKIARFQARKALEDPKAFVNYTPEQIEKAKQEIAAHPELKKQSHKDKLKTGMIPSIINLFKDRKAYKTAIKNDTDESKKVTRELSPEELTQAKKDQEVLQRTVRIINNEAEKYSENMEVASQVLINGTPFLGAGVGLVISTILNKTGILKKIISSKVNKNGSEKTKELYKEFSKLKENAPGYHIKWKQFFTSYMNDLKQARFKDVNNTIGQNHKVPKDLIKTAKQTITGLSAHKWGRKGIIGGIGSIVTGFAGLLIGLKLQKSSARAGRYTAKRELEKDPRNFIGYTEEDYEEVKDVKNTKKPQSKIKEYAMFIPTVLKQYYAYEKYKNTEFKQNKLLQEQLQKQDVTEEQLRDAKNLQRKLFNTFEKVDDNSQTYSESMEAAVEIAQPIVTYGGLLALLTPFIYIGTQIKKGKLSGSKVLEKAINFFSKSSEKLQSKWFKKYLNNVDKNIPYKVGGTNVKYKPAATILKGINLQNDSVSDIISKAYKNLQNSTTELRKVPANEQFAQIYKFRKTIKSYLMLKDKNAAEKVDKVLEQINIANPATRADMLDILLNPKNIKNMSKENYDKAYSALRKIVENTIGREKINKFYSNIHDAFKEIPFDDLKSSITELYNNIPELKAKIPQDKIEKAFTTLAELINGNNEAIFNNKIDKQIDNLFSHKNVTEAINTLEQISNELKNIPEAINKNPELSNMLNMLKTKEIPVNEEIIKELNKFNIEIKPGTTNLTINDALNIFSQTKDKIKAYTIKDIYQNIPKDIINPKKSLQSFKTHIESLTDEQFAQQMGNIGFSSINKETMLKILPKIEKILDNIPKEEMQKIWTTLIKEFNEHPYEFIKLVKTGKIGNFFITPGLKNTIAALGISWTVFTLALTYAIESWLADMQLKAGRLGVMKAIESLDDPRYYANIEPTEPLQKPAKSNTNNNTNTNTNLLARIKQ